jgi:hypothetical protein
MNLSLGLAVQGWVVLTGCLEAPFSIDNIHSKASQVKDKA